SCCSGWLAGRFAHRNVRRKQIKGLANEDLLAQRTKSIATLEVLHKLGDRDFIARSHFEYAPGNVLLGNFQLLLLGDAQQEEVTAYPVLRALLCGANELALVLADFVVADSSNLILADDVAKNT